VALIAHGLLLLLYLCRSPGDAVGGSWRDFDGALPHSRIPTAASVMAATTSREIDSDSIVFDGHEASLSQSERPGSWTVNPHLLQGEDLLISGVNDPKSAIIDWPHFSSPTHCKELQISLLVAYHKRHGDWPCISYHDPHTGSPLGVFLDRVIDRSISLTERQREVLLARDPDVFGVNYQLHRAAHKAKNMLMTKEEKLTRLMVYHEHHHTWPSVSYKDPESGVSLGVFLEDVRQGMVSLTETQRALLHAEDPKLFHHTKSARTSAGAFCGGIGNGKAGETDAMDLLLNSVICNLV